jgi:hypothetical protein
MALLGSVSKLSGQWIRSLVRPNFVWLTLFMLLPTAVYGASAQESAEKAADSSTQSAPEQPIPFSHKTHVAFQLACVYCHTNPEPGNQMTMPTAERCMGCHARVATDRPAIQQLAKYARSKEPIPWKQLYSVPSFVYWSHRTHIDGKVGCEACHGELAQMDVTAKVTNVTTMAGCVGCHRQKEAPTGCETCHESQSSQLGAPALSFMESRPRQTWR